MNVRQTYEKYFTPKNLQEHMLRVASLSKIICDNWIGSKIDMEAVIKACSLHDIAKPMTFDVSKQAQYGASPIEIANLENLQKLIKISYGSVEHEATIKMCQDVGMDKKSVNFVKNLEWKYIPRLFKNNDIESLIPIYCDMRIGPKGILSLQERFDDLKKRVSADNYEDNVKNGKALEQKIKENVKIDLNSITDNNLNSLFTEILDLEI